MMGAGSGPLLAFSEPCCHQAEIVSVKASYLGSCDGDSHGVGRNWPSGGCGGWEWVFCHPECAPGQRAPGCPFICALHGRLDHGSTAAEGPQMPQGRPEMAAPGSVKCNWPRFQML